MAGGVKFNDTALNYKPSTMNKSCINNLPQSYNFSRKTQNGKLKLSSQQFYVQAAA